MPLTHISSFRSRVETSTPHQGILELIVPLFYYHCLFQAWIWIVNSFPTERYLDICLLYYFLLDNFVTWWSDIRSKFNLVRVEWVARIKYQFSSFYLQAWIPSWRSSEFWNSTTRSYFKHFYKKGYVVSVRN